MADYSDIQAAVTRLSSDERDSLLSLINSREERNVQVIVDGQSVDVQVMPNDNWGVYFYYDPQFKYLQHQLFESALDALVDEDDKIFWDAHDILDIYRLNCSVSELKAMLV